LTNFLETKGVPALKNFVANGFDVKKLKDVLSSLSERPNIYIKNYKNISL
jgi:hypothetical protein